MPTFDGLSPTPLPDEDRPWEGAAPEESLQFIPEPEPKRTPAMQRLRDRGEAAFHERFQDAFASSNIFMNSGRIRENVYRNLKTPTIVLTEDMLKDVADQYGLDDEMKLRFYEAAGMAADEEDLGRIARNVHDDYERLQRMSKAGLSTNLLGAGAGALLDPTLWAGGVVAGGLGVYKSLTTGTRLARVLKSSGYAGAATGTQEAVLSGADTTIEAKDIAIATAIGAALAGMGSSAYHLYKNAGGKSVPNTARLEEHVDRDIVVGSEPVAVRADRALVPVEPPPEVKSGPLAIFAQPQTREIDLPPRVVEGEIVFDLPTDRRLLERQGVTVEGEVVGRGVQLEGPGDRTLTASPPGRQGRLVPEEAPTPREIEIGGHKALQARIKAARTKYVEPDELFANRKPIPRWEEAYLTKSDREGQSGLILDEADIEDFAKVIRLHDERDVQINRRIYDAANARIREARPDELRTAGARAAGEEAAEAATETGSATKATQDDLGGDTTGAARDPEAVVNPELRDTEDLAQRLDDQVDERALKGIRFAKARFGLSQSLLKSKSRLARQIGVTLFPDSGGFIDPKALQRQTTYDLKHLMENQMVVHGQRAIFAGFNKWADAKGVPKWKKFVYAASKEWDDFNQQVTESLISGRTSDDQFVREAVKGVQEQLERDLKLGQKYGVFSMDIDVNEAYLPRILNPGKYMNLRARVGEDGIILWLQKAFQARHAVSDDVARAVARVWNEKLKNGATGMNDMHFFGIPADQVDFMAGVLSDLKYTPDQIGMILDALKRKANEPGTIPSAKRRFDIDPETTIEIRGHTVGYRDLYETNASLLLAQYGRRLGGAVALKRTLGIVGTDSEISNIGKMVRSSVLDEDGSVNVADDIETKTVAALRVLAGKPMDPRWLTPSGAPTPFTRVSGAAMKMAFSMFMGQSSFASVAELGLTSAKGGFGLVFASIANFRKFTRAARTGNIGEGAIDTLDEWFATGGEDLTHPFMSRTDDLLADALEDVHGTRMERFLTQSQRVMAERISLLGPLTRLQRRQAALGIMRQIENWAYKNGDLSDAQKYRLTQMGLDEKDLEQLRKLFDANQMSIRSKWTGKNYTSADIERLTESHPELMDRFRVAVFREAHRTIVEHQMGDVPMWSLNPLGQMGTQFMKFAINAHEKLFIRALTQQTVARGQDWEQWLGFTYSMMYASVAYMAQTYINTIGRPEAREKALEADTIALRAFARSGFAALLPQATDFVTNTLYDQAIFNARSTPLPSGKIGSIPVVSIGDSMITAVQGLSSALLNPNRQVDRQTARAALSLLPPVSSMAGIRGITEFLASEMPKDAIIDKDLEYND